jgi:hypothetical protein
VATLAAQDIIEFLKESINAGNRVLFQSRQKSIGESIAADVYDDVIGFIPFVGDAISNVPRTAIAGSQADEEAIFLHGIDTIIGSIPVIGDIIDIFLPANTALKLLECSRTNNKAECLVPADSFERKTLALLERYS